MEQTKRLEVYDAELEWNKRQVQNAKSLLDQLAKEKCELIRSRNKAVFHKLMEALKDYTWSIEENDLLMCSNSLAYLRLIVDHSVVAPYLPKDGTIYSLYFGDLEFKIPGWDFHDRRTIIVRDRKKYDPTMDAIENIVSFIQEHNLNVDFSKLSQKTDNRFKLLEQVKNNQ